MLSEGSYRVPTYDYQCSVCNHPFELRHGFNGSTVRECPICKGEAYRKLHSVAVIYKGSGFYTTDYARKGSPANSSSSKSSSSSSSDSSSDSSDSASSDSTSSSDTPE